MDIGRQGINLRKLAWAMRDADDRDDAEKWKLQAIGYISALADTGRITSVEAEVAAVRLGELFEWKFDGRSEYEESTNHH